MAASAQHGAKKAPPAPRRARKSASVGRAPAGAALSKSEAAASKRPTLPFMSSLKILEITPSPYRIG